VSKNGSSKGPKGQGHRDRVRGPRRNQGSSSKRQHSAGRGGSRGSAGARRPRYARKDMDQLEGRNVVLEALKRGQRQVFRIALDSGAKRNDKLDQILELARQHDVKLERISRDKLDEYSEAEVHNGIMAEAAPLPEWTLAQRMDDVFDAGELPFFVLVDEVNYEHNLGAILRSALGAGVHGVVVPVRRGKGLTAVVQRVAMGGAEEVPLIREGLSSALATLRRAGVRVVGADMDGEACWDVPMTGALAIVLGGEDKGLSPTLRERCDAIVAVPTARDLESLNVSVTGAVLMFEKVRQDRSRDSS
jgi:23S rRNA (guanosine2251-2'-O)-methyltransferase